jgi:hypothetical protein
MLDFLGRFYDRNLDTFWPWLLLVALLTAVSYFWYLEGRSAQDAMDRYHTVREYARGTAPAPAPEPGR